MRVVFIAHTKNTGILRVLQAKTTQGWGVVGGVVVFGGGQGVHLEHYITSRAFIADSTDVSQKVPLTCPNDYYIYAENTPAGWFLHGLLLTGDGGVCFCHEGSVFGAHAKCFRVGVMLVRYTGTVYFVHNIYI